MRAGAPHRLRIVTATGAVLATLAAGLGLGAGAARSGPEPDALLLPDLVVERPKEVYLTRNGEQLRLRTSNTIANRGVGPLEISGDPAGAPCALDGKPPGRPTLQAIYEDATGPGAGSPGYFWRGEDTATADPAHHAGCSRYHPKHDHWHFDNFARFTLIAERSGKPAGVARKVSFCVLDGAVAHPGLAGTPKTGYYPQDPAAPDPRRPTCSQTSIDGLSIGWADTYSAGLPGQGIRLERPRRGRYCLVLEVDPPLAGGGVAGALLESREDNNVRELRLRLRPGRLEVRRLAGPCRLPG